MRNPSQLAETGKLDEGQHESGPALAAARQLVSFCFFRLDPAWRRLPRTTKNKHTGELQAVVQHFSKRLMVLKLWMQPAEKNPISSSWI